MADDKWKIVNKKGEVVGTATSKDSARKVRDRHDNKYGGYQHSIRPPQNQTPAPWAKEGPSGRDFAQEDATSRLGELAKQRKAMIDWSAQEKADLDSGRKKAPLTSNEKAMANFKDLGEAVPGTTKQKAQDRRASVQLAREINPAWNKAHKAAQDITPYQIGPNADAKANKGDARMARSMEAKDLRSKRMIAEGRLGDPSPMPGSPEDLKSAGLRDTLDLGKRTAAHNLQSREFPKTKSGDLEFGTPKKDLGRSVLNIIRREADIPSSEGSLRKLAQKRVAQSRSVAGPDAPSVPKNRSILKRGPGAAVGKIAEIESKRRAALALGGAAGKLGGKLGAYGMIKGVVEGAETLRKMKSGAYDLTPEGSTKLKKGYTES